MPKEPAKKAPVRPKRTKAETEEMFVEVENEVEAAKQLADPKADAAARARDIQIKKAVEGVSVDDIVRKLSGLGLEVTRSLADISEKLADEVRLLAVVREAVTVERAELEHLHKVDIVATTLDHLVAEHQEKTDKFDTEMANRRAAWQEDVSKTEREKREHDENLRKSRAREAEDFEYKKVLERKKQQDKSDEELRLAEKANREKQDDLTKDWERREAQLKDREERAGRLESEVTEFPAKLAKAIEEAEARVRRDVESRFEPRILGLTKDAEAEKRIAEIQAKSQEQALKQAASQIAALEKQLTDAKLQVQDIAVKAIEGASGSKTLAHINQIAMEQAKNRPQG